MTALPHTVKLLTLPLPLPPRLLHVRAGVLLNSIVPVWMLTLPA